MDEEEKYSTQFNIQMILQKSNNAKVKSKALNKVDKKSSGKKINEKKK